MHFEAVKLTSIESLGKQGGSLGSRELLKKSNTELKRLLKEIESQRLEKDDLRYEVFSRIVAMLEDDIQVRLDVNLKI